MADFKRSITNLLRREGGEKLTKIKGDNGGLTKFGISQKSYPDLDIAKMTESTARAIYKHDYWDCIRGDEIDNQRIANVIFDTAVNMGVPKAVKLAQSVVGVTVDGHIGPVTLGALNHRQTDDSIKAFVTDYTELRCLQYRRFVKEDATQAKFLDGWLNRAAEVSAEVV